MASSLIFRSLNSVSPRMLSIQIPAHQASITLAKSWRTSSRPMNFQAMCAGPFEPGRMLNIRIPAHQHQASVTIAKSWRASSRPMNFRAMCAGPSEPWSKKNASETIENNPVVVYHESHCSYHREIINMIQKLGANPRVITLDKYGMRQLKIKLKGIGHFHGTMVFIGGKHYGITDINRLHKERKLEDLLLEARAIEPDSESSDSELS